MKMSYVTILPYDNMIVWENDDCAAIWLCDSMTVWQYDSMTVWLCDSMTVWQHDCVTIWLCDNMTVW